MKTLENVVVLSLEDYEQLMKNQKSEELEVGKWYFVDRSKKIPNDNKALVMYQGQGVETYGFSHSDKFINCYGISNTFSNPEYVYTKATHQEVEQALIKEAKKRGFKEGVNATREWIYPNARLVTLNRNNYTFNPSINSLTLDGWEIFYKGKWAEIIPEREYKEGDIVISESCGSQFITEHKCGSIGNYQCHRFVSGDKKSLSYGGSYTNILRHANNEEKEIFNNLANPKPKIDYDRLKTGSVVMVSNNGDQIFFDIDHNYPCTILNIDSGYIIDRIGQLSKSNYKHTLNLIQEGAKLACYATSSKPTYITEVISY